MALLVFWPALGKGRWKFLKEHKLGLCPREAQGHWRDPRLSPNSAGHHRQGWNKAWHKASLYGKERWGKERRGGGQELSGSKSVGQDPCNKDLSTGRLHNRQPMSPSSGESILEIKNPSESQEGRICPRPLSSDRWWPASLSAYLYLNLPFV